MTDDLFRQVYETARAAAHPNGMLACEDADISELADALDQIIEECDAWEGDLASGRWTMVFPISKLSSSTLARVVEVRKKGDPRRKKGSPRQLVRRILSFALFTLLLDREAQEHHPK